MTRFAATVVLAFLGLSGCGSPMIDPRPWTLDELEIAVTDTSRLISFTNKQAGFFVAESNGFQSSGWQGWFIMSVKMMEDYRIAIDGKNLDRSEVKLARVWPDRFTRSYPQGVQENISLLDSVDVLVVEITHVRGRTVTAAPLFGIADSMAFLTAARNGILLISRKNHQTRTRREDYPVWVGMTMAEADNAVAGPSVSDGRLFSPARLESPLTGGDLTVLFGAGDTQEGVLETLNNARSRLAALRTARRDRMERVLNRSLLRTSNGRLDKALSWAKLSMDALIMNQGKKGIFAGLPWFSNYWGRDTYISLPGATLVTGDFGEAREILSSFAEWQNTDPKSPDEGRIPNLVTPSSISYNTTDGTPWFASAVFDYGKYSGDTAFVRSMFPVLRRAIEGALKHRTDKDFFLTHGDAETWMDAVGSDGPWSPRGNRANDVQALWYRQLVVSTAIAESMGDRETAEQWHNIAQTLLGRFQEKFIDDRNGLLFDHLNVDGSADSSIRPNQLFALELVADPTVREKVFRNVTEQLVYEHGIASLAQTDLKFHPYHQNEPLYPKDAAYHNGTVWTWLAGPWIKNAAEFARPNLAFKVTENMVHQILERGAVGTLSELVDAVPRNNEPEPRLSGTFSQAWSLAEFIRTVYQSYLGISVDAQNQQVWLFPQLPHAISGVTVDVHVGPSTIRVSYARDGTSGKISVASVIQDEPISITLGWPFPNKRGRSCGFTLEPGQVVHLDLTEDRVTSQARNPEKITVDSNVQFLTDFPLLSTLSLATPKIREELASLQPPPHELLTGNEINKHPRDPLILVDKTDPLGDDRGPGTFVYPTTTTLRAGSLDLTRFVATTGDSLVRFELSFRTLSDPGWHPEYGFQLTAAAIAIDTDGRTNSGRRDIGFNAKHRLTPDRAYERLVFVSGGIHVEDADGKTLAQYTPRQDGNIQPIGNSATGRIAFSVPVRLLGEPASGWRFTVLVGAQDDHGGGGIGDFRSVALKAGEWVGGGRRGPGDSNIYDILESDAGTR